jgi:hypothetical protein
MRRKSSWSPVCLCSLLCQHFPIRFWGVVIFCRYASSFNYSNPPFFPLSVSKASLINILIMKHFSVLSFLLICKDKSTQLQLDILYMINLLWGKNQFSCLNRRIILRIWGSYWRTMTCCLSFHELSDSLRGPRSHVYTHMCTPPCFCLQLPASKVSGQSKRLVEVILSA